MKKCKHCGSAAINPHQHGRKADTYLDLCDVCYWRKHATVLEHLLLDAWRRKDLDLLSALVPYDTEDSDMSENKFTRATVKR